MPAPPEFRDRLVARLTHLLPRLVDHVWDAAVMAQKGSPNKEVTDGNHQAMLADAVTNAVVKPRKKRSRPKLRQGEAREAVRKVIEMFPEGGISRAEIARKVRPLLGQDISPNTLKRALMDLRQTRMIFTLNRAWYPSHAHSVGDDKAPPLSKAAFLRGHTS